MKPSSGKELNFWSWDWFPQVSGYQECQIIRHQIKGILLCINVMLLNVQYSIHTYSAEVCYNYSTCQSPIHVNLPIPHMVTMPPSTMPVPLCVSDSKDVNCGLYMVRWGDWGRPSLAFLPSKSSLSLRAAACDALATGTFNLQGKDVT